MSYKEKDRDLLAWYDRQIKASNVKVNLNCEVKSLKEIHADEYVVATGSIQARKLTVPGAERCIPAVSYLNQPEMTGDNIVIVGGGITGCEIAYELCLMGKHPTIVELGGDIMSMKGLSMANSSFLRDAFEFYNIPILTDSKVTCVNADSVAVATADGEVTLPADTVVVSMGYMSGNPFESEVAENVHILGDANKVANLYQAIWAANDLAIELDM